MNSNWLKNSCCNKMLKLFEWNSCSLRFGNIQFYYFCALFSGKCNKEWQKRTTLQKMLKMLSMTWIPFSRSLDSNFLPLDWGHSGNLWPARRCRTSAKFQKFELMAKTRAETCLGIYDFYDRPFCFQFHFCRDISNDIRFLIFSLGKV